MIFRGGAIAGIDGVTLQLQKHFPVASGDRNELSDRPVVLGSLSYVSTRQAASQAQRCFCSTSLFSHPT